jgi:hypothetical protein
MRAITAGEIILLNGKAVPDCIAYDVELGLVRANERKGGRLVIEGDRAKVVQLEGDVEVTTNKLTIKAQDVMTNQTQQPMEDGEVILKPTPSLSKQTRGKD